MRVGDISSKKLLCIYISIFQIDIRVMKVENDVPTIFNPKKPRLSQSNAVLTSDHRPYGPFSHVLSRSESCKVQCLLDYNWFKILNRTNFYSCFFFVSMSTRRSGTGRTMPEAASGHV